ncbi:MAG: hypothetical protein HC879_00420 [Leptolyngbyaceae cyanobacterium SL_5_9]|nr:hypothetical protein [Leptolyngbyaceae cyanobacterium SL_5_9]
MNTAKALELRSPRQPAKLQQIFRKSHPEVRRCNSSNHFRLYDSSGLAV